MSTVSNTMVRQVGLTKARYASGMPRWPSTDVINQ